MVELVFETFIERNIDFVFDNLYKRDVFRSWGTAFSPNPTYTGVISKGNKVSFGDGDVNGMIGLVDSYIENKEIVFTYIEQTIGGVTTPFDEGLNERYDFSIVNAETTLLTVTLTIPNEWEDDMKKMWGEAIVNIKHTMEKL